MGVKLQLLFVILISTVVVGSKSEEVQQMNKKKRGIFGWGVGSSIPYYNNNGYGLWNPWNSNRGFPIPFWNVYYPPGVGNVWNVPQFGFFDFQIPPFNGALPPQGPSTAVKPVTEPSLEPPPPQAPPRPKVSVARPITPPFSASPPPGSKQNRPVSLGSGSLGVVQLANGGFTLGSGSIGYSPIGPPSPPKPQPTPAALQVSSPGTLEVNNVEIGPNAVSYSLAPLEGYLPPSTSPQYTAQIGQVQAPTREPAIRQPVLVDSYAKIRYEAESFANGNSAPATESSSQVQRAGNFRVSDGTVALSPPETRGYSSTIGLSGYS